MKLLIATPLLPTESGGPAQYAVGLRKSLEAEGHHICVIAFDEVRRYPSVIRHFVLLLKSYSCMRDADAVIVLDTVSMALPLSLASFLARKRLLIRVGGDFVWEHFTERTQEKVFLSEFYKKRMRLSFKERLVIWIQRNIVFPLADVLIFSTGWQRDIWMKPYELEHRRVAVIENAYAPFVSREQSISDSSVVTWIGRDRVLKNVQTLDAAVVPLKKEYPALEYRRFSALPHEKVLEALRESRILVIPSFSEVSPNLALEALALRVPVLLTKDCGLRDVLKDAVTWIDPMSVGDLTREIRELMTAEGYVRAREKAARFHGVRTYADIGKEFLKLLACGRS
jgi:glycosyltransferase involved in cell wall biosynthesis